jgi:hypothetical protein
MCAAHRLALQDEAAPEPGGTEGMSRREPRESSPDNDPVHSFGRHSHGG